MEKFIQGCNSPNSPKAETPVKKKAKKGASRNLMRLTYAARYDTMDHWPKPISEVPCVECKEEANISCKKCKVALCLNRGRNCFIMYHTPPKGKIICIPKFAPPLAFVSYEESSTSERELSSDSESDLDHSESDLD